MLSIGDTAPDFEGTDQHGQALRRDDLVTDSAVVLYFYPRDFSPICTKQACLLRDVHDDLHSFS